MKTALTIAGSDPTGGAGLQADLKVFRSFGVHGLSVISAVTAQNTEVVDSIFPLEQEAFEKQLRILLSDIRPDAVKTGMLYSGRTVETLAEHIREYSLHDLVIDPVTVSSSGTTLMDEGTLDILKEKLFPIAKMITPNIYEASVLTGVMIETVDEMEEAARALKMMGPDVVVITGGHLENIALDLFYDGEFHRVESEKLRGEFHGTGCAFSAAVAALLALGHSPIEAVRKAKEFMNNAIKRAYHPGRGMGILNT
ncbi:MAG TPA: bifunctional hydroxymethylpyrimidine kinase/phosphomethylpyrimidine kinase [Thermodesulfovibrionales bacterium]|nr:bifunctional hydroxymethylpyrimidine kinase/phosphomethylpyrimidine kinase [Thermodesulfovibrionales bacterium]